MNKVLDDNHIHDGHRERMRSKLIIHGQKVFDTYELLEMLLYYTIPYKDTNPISKRLLFTFGGLDGVLLCTDGVLGPYQSTENFKRSFVRPVVRRILDGKTNEVKQFVCDLGLRSGVGDDVSLSMIVKDDAKVKKYQ